MPEGATTAPLAGDPVAVANAAEAAIILAAKGGLDVVGAKSIALAFDDNGDVTVECESADGAKSSGTISATDIAKIDDTAEDRESVPPPAPQE